jgi:bifunctional ADP-heptose synthase (sugar kinase/adenylyltransferase)
MQSRKLVIGLEGVEHTSPSNHLLPEILAALGLVAEIVPHSVDAFRDVAFQFNVTNVMFGRDQYESASRFIDGLSQLGIKPELYEDRLIDFDRKPLEQLYRKFQRDVLRKEFFRRGKTDLLSIDNFLSVTDQKNILVIGDTIVDSYVDCGILKKSQDSQRLIYKLASSGRNSLGGAAVVVEIIRTLRSYVDFMTLGNLEIIKMLGHNFPGENFYIVGDDRKPTIKSRYICDDELVFRINDFDDSPISKDLEDVVFQRFLELVTPNTLLIFSDFGYGLLTDGLVRRITNYCISNSIEFVVDAQASSQVADLSKYRGGGFLFATEHEIRTLLGNFTLGIQAAANQALQKLGFKNLILKLGPDGALWVRNSDGFPSTYFPPFARVALNITGAGDVMLSAFAAAYVRGNDIFDSILFGNVASSAFVETPIHEKLTLGKIYETLKLNFDSAD